MTVNELTRQTLYPRASWQRVYDAAMCYPDGAEHWDSICRQAIRNSVLSPPMAMAMLRMIKVPPATKADLDALAEYGERFHHWTAE